MGYDGKFESVLLSLLLRGLPVFFRAYLSLGSLLACSVLVMVLGPADELFEMLHCSGDSILFRGKSSGRGHISVQKRWPPGHDVAFLFLTSLSHIE